MTQGLRAQESTLFDLLSPGIEMAMPPYQRSYSWDVEEAQALLTDLSEIVESGDVHFIGAIVLVRENNGGYLIVDGQQRLTTLTILLSVLRDMETDPKWIADIHNLIGDDAKLDTSRAPSWRITLNHIDGPFFREAIQAPGATLTSEIEPNDGESQKRMVQNAAYFAKEVRALSPESRRKLAKAIQEQLMLVKVVVEDWDGGYNVFRVLNTRGKAPNSHDIIKTDLLENANLSAKDASEFSRQWSEHEARLGGSGFDDLLSQIRALHTRKNKKGATEFRKAVIGRQGNGARDFLSKDLPAYVDAYVTISSGEAKFSALSEEINVALNYLRLIDHQLWRAPALKFLVNHNGSPQTALDFFNNLERFAYAAMMVITEPRARQRRYQRLSDAADDPRQLLSNNGPLALTKDERRKIIERLEGRFGAFAQRRAMALRLNGVIAGGRALGPNDRATVEHVLPRTLPDDSPWKTAWPGSGTHRELVDTIGNFALLTQHTNLAADNLGFVEKKALYFADGEPEFALTKDIEGQMNWTPDTVRTRTTQLAAILADTWQLDSALLK
ncbi:MAG: DUF262 domain-containing HNH endonuclease family protein [Henriciella sp.]|nr:DUF262 domain-containing HNH endonuclease family protein [Henriciella sp.]